MNVVMQTLLQSHFFTDCQQKLREAKTTAQLEECARMLDTQAFEDLPSAAREDLASLYAHRLYHITGALLQ